MAMNRRVFGAPPARAAGERGWNAAWEIDNGDGYIDSLLVEVGHRPNS
jgi:hypothetical protein